MVGFEYFTWEWLYLHLSCLGITDLYELKKFGNFAVWGIFISSLLFFLYSRGLDVLILPHRYLKSHHFCSQIFLLLSLYRFGCIYLPLSYESGAWWFHLLCVAVPILFQYGAVNYSILFFWEKVLLYNPGWPQIHDLLPPPE